MIKSIIQTISGALRVLLTPSCWIQVHPYCPEWDELLRRLMAEYPFTPIDAHTASIGGVEVWTSNHPYGSFYQWIPEIKLRPRRITTLRAFDKLQADILASKTTKPKPTQNR